MTSTDADWVAGPGSAPPARVRSLELAKSEWVELAARGRWAEADDRVLSAIDGVLAEPSRMTGPDLAGLVYLAGTPRTDSPRCVKMDMVPEARRSAMHAVMLVNHAVERDQVVALAKRVLDSPGAEEPGTYWHSMFALMYADEVELARAVHERAAGEESWQKAYPRQHVLALIQARLDWLDGDSVRAHDRLEELLAGGVYEQFAGLAVAWAVAAKVELGDLSGAAELLRSNDFGGSLAGIADRAEVLLARGLVHRAAGRPVAACADFLACGSELRGWAMANPAVLGWRGQAARSARETLRETLAETLAQEELVEARRWGARRAIGNALAAVALASSTPGEDVKLLEKAAELLSGPRMRRELMHVQYELGTRLCLHKEYEAGVRALAGAGTAARDSGHRVWAERVGDTIRRWGPDGGFRGLTLQALKVAALARNGFENKEIAAMLHLTSRTVEFHLSNVYRKLGVTGRPGLASVLIPSL